MLVTCDIAFQHVVAEYLHRKQNEFETLRENILISLLFLSAIRWLNNTEDLGLNFDGLALNNFYDAANLSLDKEKCLMNIEQRSPKKKRSIAEAEIHEKTANISDYYNICNGHDVLKAFALHLSSHNREGINHEHIAGSLRIAYRKEDFAETALFANLKNWESQTGYSLFAA
jgi:hypothetical protein